MENTKLNQNQKLKCEVCMDGVLSNKGCGSKCIRINLIKTKNER